MEVGSLHLEGVTPPGVPGEVTPGHYTLGWNDPKVTTPGPSDTVLYLLVPAPGPITGIRIKLIVLPLTSIECPTTDMPYLIGEWDGCGVVSEASYGP